jgi:hypothetical protein
VAREPVPLLEAATLRDFGVPVPFVAALFEREPFAAAPFKLDAEWPASM